MTSRAGGELEIRMRMQTSQFRDSIRELSSSLKNMGQSVKNVGGTLSKGLSLPIVGLGAAALGMAANTAKMAGELDDAAKAAGVNVETFQEVQFALQRAGVNEDQVNRLLQRTTQRMGRAAEGNEKYGRAFMQLGIAVKDVNGEMRSSEEVFNDVLRGLAAIEDPAIRAARAGELLGTNSGRKLAGALSEGIGPINELREAAREQGLVMSEEAVDAAIEFADAMDDLKQNIAAMVREVGSEFIPIFQNSLLPLFQDEVMPLFRQFMGFVQGLAERFKGLSPNVQLIILGGLGLAAALGPLLLIVGSIISAVGALIGILPLLGAAFTLMLGPVGLIILAIAALIAGFVLAWQHSETFRTIVQGVFEFLQLFIQEAMIVIRAILVDTLEFLRDLWALWGDDIMSIVAKVWELVRVLTDLAMTVLRHVVTTTLDLLSDFWDAWGDTILGILEVLWGLVRAVTVETWTNIKDVISGMLQIIEGILDIFVGVLTGDWERAWEGMQDVVKGAVNVLRAYANQIIGIFEAIVNAIGDAIGRIKIRVPRISLPFGGSVGGFSVSLPGFNISLPRIPKLARGGTALTAGMALVGEAGPEILSMPRGATVTPLGSGGGPTIIVELDGEVLTRVVGRNMVEDIRVRTGLRA